MNVSIHQFRKLHYLKYLNADTCLKFKHQGLTLLVFYF
jgi:hypothetical protein